MLSKIIILFVLLISADVFAANVSYIDYVNNRFGYSVSIPQNWKQCNFSQNGDGVGLCVKEKGVQIGVFGAFYNEDYKEIIFRDLNKNNYSKKDVLLNSGDKAVAIIGKTSAKIDYKVYYIKDGIYAGIYINAPLSFYEKNKNIIEKVSKSIDILPSGRWGDR